MLYITVSNNYGAQIKLQMPLCISYLAIIISFLLTLGISLLSWYLAIKNNNSTKLSEEQNAFFVGASRAKEKLIFTNGQKSNWPPIITKILKDSQMISYFT